MFRTIGAKSLPLIAAGIGAMMVTGCASSNRDAAAGMFDHGDAAATGIVTVTVRHSENKILLAGIPVILQTPGKNEPKAAKLFGVTDKNGVVDITRVPEGAYHAVVNYNNNTAASPLIKVSENSHIFVTVYFNPDID